MKRKTIFFFMAFFTMTMYSQIPQLDSIGSEKLLRRAFEYRNGINRSVNLGKAAIIYKHLCHRGNIEAMVPFGEMKLHVEGVEKDLQGAFALFDRAAKCGDTLAMCHMADMYRQGIGVRQNFSKAALLYRMAADRGSAQGCYGLGYLAYKGMGVKQDYEAAVRFLTLGATKNHPGCCFLLGLYYARGYDCEPDYQLSEQFMNKAKRAGHGWASDIVEFSTIDSIMSWNERSQLTWTHVGRHKIPAQGMMQIEENVELDSIAGQWEGSLYTYDWSGSRIIKEETINLSIHREMGRHVVTFSKGDSILTVFLPTWREGKWIMLKSDIERNYGWFITSSKFMKQSDGTLMVDMKSRNMATREIRRPTFAVMQLTETDDIIEGGFSIRGVSPSVVTNGIFQLNIETLMPMAANIALYNSSGVMVKNFGRAFLIGGGNSITLQSSQSSGIYILRVSAQGKVKSINIVFGQ